MEKQFLERLELQMDLKGVFCLPSEWKTSDESNPSQFDYSISFSKVKMEKGHYCAREASEQELREQEELQKNKNNKKDVKGVQQTMMVDGGLTEEEKERQEQERLEQEAWEQLDPEEQFIRTQETRTKSPWVGWEEHSTKTLLEHLSLIQFEERVMKDGGEWIYLVKEPSLSKEEVDKVKKSKPKGINLGDLQAVFFRGWLDYSSLQEGHLSTQQRVTLQQVYPGYTGGNDPLLPSDLPRPSTGRLYVHLVVTIDQSFRSQEKPRPVQDYLVKLLPEKQDSKEVQAVKELGRELEIIYQSLAIEFSNQFGKELNLMHEQLNKQMAKPKQQEATKRRELFLYNFNISGKYKVLKDRVKKNIVNICKEKFKKTGSITGVTTDSQDQFYSEIFTFLMQQMRTTLDQVIQNQKETLHEDVLPFYQQALAEQQDFLGRYRGCDQAGAIQQLAMESQLLNQPKHTQKHLRKLVKLDKKDHHQWFQLCKLYSLQRQPSMAQESLMECLKHQPSDQTYLLVNGLLLGQRGKMKECLLFLNHLVQQHDSVGDDGELVFLYALLALYNPSNTHKYTLLMYRHQMRLLSMLPPIATFQQQPIPSELPIYQHQAINEHLPVPSLDQDQLDHMYTTIIQKLYDLNLVSICEQFLDKIKKPSRFVSIVMAQLIGERGEVEKSIQMLEELLKEDCEDVKLLQKIGDLCFEFKHYDRCYDIYIQLLRQRNSTEQDKFNIFLKLGTIKLEQALYGQAVIFFTKTAQLNRASPTAFRGLGQSFLGYGDLEQAEHALTHANLLDPYDEITWFSIIKMCILQKDFIRSNQVMRELLKLKVEKYEMVVEIVELYKQEGEERLGIECLLKYLEEDQYLSMQQATTLYKHLAKMALMSTQHHYANQVLQKINTFYIQATPQDNQLAELKNELTTLVNA